MKPNNVDAYQHLVNRLSEARKQAGISQWELGEILEKPQSHVSKIESHDRKLNLVDFVYWARALGVDPTELFSELERTLGKGRQLRREAQVLGPGEVPRTLGKKSSSNR